MRPTAFTEYKFQEIAQAHQSENDRLRELLKEATEEISRLRGMSQSEPNDVLQH